MNFKKYHVGKVLLIKSDLEQSMINKIMMEYYYANNEMMPLEELDEDAQAIPIQSYEFTNLMSYGDKKTKKIFKKFVIFFTDEMVKLLSPPTKNIFIKGKQQSNVKYLSFEYQMYKLTDDEDNELNKLKKKKIIFEQESSKIIMKNINDKINGALENIKIINLLNN
jgi:hypothetical protein